MSDSDHQPWDDELAAFALGALDPHEAAAFEGHLVHCDRCRAELHRLAPAVELLPLSVERREPPASLRRSIMDVVDAEAAQSQAPLPASPAPRPSRELARWRAWFWRPAPIAGLAATLAVAFFAGFALRGGGGGAHDPTVPVRATANAPVGATLVRDGGAWRLNVERMPSLPSNAVYQVWVRRPRDGVTSGGVFVLARDGTATVGVPQPLHPGDQLLVTREPAGGSPRPTSAPLAQANVT
ncbi:MAG: anti-ECFsigma factor, ChrR [Conexibacter sp.]|nr:anti-ECFsigma factor, ChrR [Conexibacter sp.]